MGTDHLGGDILAERRLTGEELRRALGSLLSVTPDQVFVFQDWQDLPNEPDPTKVHCRYWHPQGGDFHTEIDLPDALLHSIPRDATASRLAKLLGCRLLVDDGSVNPYAFLLYDRDGGIRPVSVNVDATDRDKFVVDDHRASDDNER